MEDLFKFIPIVLWLIYKFAGSGKGKEVKPKQRKKPQNSPSASQRKQNLEDILRELSGEKTPKPQVEVQPEPVRQTRGTTRKKRQKIDIVDHQYDFRPEYEHHADVDLDLKVVRSHVAGTADINGGEEDFDFDYLSEIIAQTILERPQY